MAPSTPSRGHFLVRPVGNNRMKFETKSYPKFVYAVNNLSAYFITQPNKKTKKKQNNKKVQTAEVAPLAYCYADQPVPFIFLYSCDA